MNCKILAQLWRLLCIIPKVIGELYERPRL